jgi:predicted DNA-binding protein with PD1-like motif
MERTRQGGTMATTKAFSGTGYRVPKATPITPSTGAYYFALAVGASVVACGVPRPPASGITSATQSRTEAQQVPGSDAPVTAPGVRAKLIGQKDATRTYQLVLAPGTEAVAAISDFVVQNHIQAAHFQGLGACTDAVLGYYDPLTHAYQKTAYTQQMEIVSIIGDVAPTPGYGAGFHAHIGVAFADGTMHGGHLFEAHVSPTLELELTASPVALHRAFDETFKTWLLVP